MRFSWVWILVAVISLGAAACSSPSVNEGGGEVASDAALHGMMTAIAPDLAKVFAAVAPTYGEAALKAPGDVTNTDCAGGGTASFTESVSGGGAGTLQFDGCTMRGVTLQGGFAGYVEVEPSLEMAPAYVHATMMRSVDVLVVSGVYNARLTVDRLDLSADLPEPSDFFTYWEMHARTAFGESLCAWSGSNSCDDIVPPF